MTNFNKRTNTHLYKDIISHTLYSKGLMLVVCDRCVGDGDRQLHIDSNSSDNSSTSFSSRLGLLNRGSLRAQSPLSAAGSHNLSPTDSNCNCNWNWPKPSVSCLYFCLTSSFFRLSTQVHLLIDGLVDGQYITRT